MSNKIDSCKHLAETERKTGVFIKSKTIAAVLLKKKCVCQQEKTIL